DVHGLLRRSSDGVVTQFRSGDGSGLPGNRIFALALDMQGNLWIGSGRGLVHRAHDGTRFESMVNDPVLRDGVITALAMMRDTTMLVGTRSGELRLVDTNTRASKPLRDDAKASTPGRGIIHAITPTSRNELWIAHSTGIEIRTLDDKRVLFRLRHDASQPHSLGGSEVRALLENRSGLIWIGSYGGGVQRHDPATRAFRNLGQDVPFDSPLRDVSVRSIAVLDDDSVVLGTDDSGLLHLDSTLTNADSLRDAVGQPLLRGQRVTALAQAGDRSLWIGSESGLTRYDLQKRTHSTQALDSGRPRRMLADPSGDVWLATQGGLFRILIATGRTERVTSLSGAALDGDVNALALARDGGLWIGGDRGLAWLARGESQARWIALTRDGQSMQPDVLGMHVDAHDQLRFDTPAGLFRLELLGPAHGRAIAIDTTADVSQPFGANLMSDAQGRIWSMRHRHDPASGRTLALGIEDGIDSGSAWFRAYAKTSDGRLLFGASKGVVVVRPDDYVVADFDPPLVITEFRLDGVLRPAPAANQTLTLAADARAFSVEFAALDFSAPERLRYRHRLHGYDADWNEGDARNRVAAYANLPPGNYQLELQGSNRGGRWSRQTLSIPVRILPAWWQTWWARATGLALLLLSIGGFVQLRTAILRTRERALECKVHERTLALEAMSVELRAKSEALEHASITDPLTGLHNRRYVDAQLQADVAHSIRQHEGHIARGSGAAPDDADLVFFLVDIDMFKQVNDHHGHAAGDAVLIAIGELLVQVFRDADHVVRWGGEEFLIVARHSTRLRAAELAERVCTAVAAHEFGLPDGNHHHLTCSIGFAAFPLQPTHPRAADWSDVVALADFAMYAVKRGGRNAWAGLDVTTTQALHPTQLRAPLNLLQDGQLAVQSSIEATRLARMWDQLAQQNAAAALSDPAA
ncbi:MAG: diguanylate cyclase domain-containing protein, partial [Thermomonas sp.]